MKISIALSVLILAVVGLFGWQGQKRLNVIREEHRVAAEEAERLGVSLEGGEAGSLNGIPLVRDRNNREVDIKRLLEDVIDFAKRMEEAEGGGGEDMQKETMEMIRRLLDLDSAELKSLIAGLKESDEIEDEMRQGIIGFSIMMLADQSPETALAIYTESADILDMDGMGEHVVASSLSQWAAKDPLAALDWIRENGKKNPDLVTEETKAAVIAGAARQDPALALKLLDELELRDSSEAMDGIASAADTQEKQVVLLETLRKLSSDDGDLKRGVFGSLSSQVIKGGYAASIKWLEEAELSSAERSRFAESLSYHQTKEDTGKWLEWMSTESSDFKEDGRYERMMSDWTRSDFQSAGTWLNEAAEGPGKVAATISYAKTVAPYEPASAAQWVETLPEGKKRRNLAKQIYKEWKKKDEAAAAMFAAEQGIE